MDAAGYNNLKRYLGYSTETTKLFDIMQIMWLRPEFGFENFYYNICAEPALIDAGVQVLNPVQISAKNMIRKN